MVKQAISSLDGNDKYSMMDEKKRKRMISNRESAKRSRMRRDNHIKDLNSEIAFLSIIDNDLVQKINYTMQQFSGINQENWKLVKEQHELTKRLESLEMVTSYIYEFENENLQCSSQPWQLNLPHQNQPLMDPVDMFNFG